MKSLIVINFAIAGFMGFWNASMGTIPFGMLPNLILGCIFFILTDTKKND